LDQQREPPFRGPWPVWAIAAAILLSFGIQDHVLDLGVAAERYGMSGLGLSNGRWGTLVSALFIHGSWGHAAMNAVGALAFGAPVARMLGLGLRGAAGFFFFYLACGVLANLGYAGVHPHDAMPLVGASGAVSGLFGGASRLMERGQGPAPFASRTVVASAAAWIAVNVVLGVMHYAPGIGDVSVAWEAHIAGYFAGLFLIGPFFALFAERDSEPDVAPEGGPTGD
jgi:membrane associated rhomboid family serine protease